MPSSAIQLRGGGCGASKQSRADDEEIEVSFPAVSKGEQEALAAVDDAPQETEVQIMTPLGTCTLRLIDGQLAWYDKFAGKDEEECSEEDVRGLKLSPGADGKARVGPAEHSWAAELATPPGTERDAVLEQLCRLAIRAGVALTGFEEVKGFDEMVAAEKARKQAEADAARQELQEAVAAAMAAWRAGDGAAAGDKEREAHERLVEWEAIAARADFRELVPFGRGCAIEKTEERAISLAQLRAVRATIERRCEAEGWATWQGQPLVPGAVALYDADKYLIRPATVARKCAFVELVAARPQPPDWFVSHWW